MHSFLNHYIYGYKCFGNLKWNEYLTGGCQTGPYRLSLKWNSLAMQVRVYTAKNVREELQEAQRDFIRASVGVSSKGRLLVPKMLHCFVRDFVDDSNLAIWISHYLPPHQAAFVEQCVSRRRQSFLGSRNCGILPFDSRFRYLFMPEWNIAMNAIPCGSKVIYLMVLDSISFLVC